MKTPTSIITWMWMTQHMNTLVNDYGQFKYWIHWLINLWRKYIARWIISPTVPIPKLGRYVLVKHQPIIQYMTFAVTECVVTCVRRFEGPAVFFITLCYFVGMFCYIVQIHFSFRQWHSFWEFFALWRVSQNIQAARTLVLVLCVMKIMASHSVT